MENMLLILKGFLQDLLSSFAFSLIFLPLFAKIFKQKIELPFNTFLNKYVISLWGIFFTLLAVFRHYDLHRNKIIGITQLIIAVVGFFNAKGIFSSEINIPMMKVILVLFFIMIVL